MLDLQKIECLLTEKFHELYFEIPLLKYDSYYGYLGINYTPNIQIYIKKPRKFLFWKWVTYEQIGFLDIEYDWKPTIVDGIHVKDDGMYTPIKLRDVKANDKEYTNILKQVKEAFEVFAKE